VREDSAKYLTLHEAAERLRVTPSTLAKWAKAGRVPALKTPGGKWRFVEADLMLALRLGRASDNGEREVEAG